MMGVDDPATGQQQGVPTCPMRRLRVGRFTAASAAVARNDQRPAGQPPARGGAGGGRGSRPATGFPTRHRHAVLTGAPAADTQGGLAHVTQSRRPLTGAPTRRGAAKRLCRQRRGCGLQASAGPRNRRTRPPSWETAPRPAGRGTLFHLWSPPPEPRLPGASDHAPPGSGHPRARSWPGPRVWEALVVPKCMRRPCGAGRFPARGGVGDAEGLMT